MGILGNERADKVAKEAVKRSVFEREIKASVRRQQYREKEKKCK